MNRTQNVLFLAIVFLLGGLCFEAWPPAARADTEAHPRVALVDLPVTGAANVLSSSITCSRNATALRVTVQIKRGATAAILQPVCLVAGADVGLDGDLNSGTELEPGQKHTFMFGIRKTSTNGMSGNLVVSSSQNKELSYNFRFSQSTTIGELYVEEVIIP